ncbi:MAG TPA: hypothetical protein VN282_11625 [Pyrinomonadaceae bacterium]|nr:hypothetical protein [Pyrinomonadaceae bacterium]
MNGVTKVRGALTAVALVALLTLGASGASAQGLLNKLKEKARPKVETSGQTGTTGTGQSGDFTTMGIGPGDGSMAGRTSNVSATAVWPGNANVSPMSVDKTSVQVQTWRRTGAGHAAPWGWTPRVSFNLNGALPQGAQLLVEFKDPAGKPWVSFACQAESRFDGRLSEVKLCDGGLPSEKGATLTGAYEFRITLHNELQGTDQQLFNGKAVVKKFLPYPDEKNHFDFYVDQDWNLPVAYVQPKPEAFYAADRAEYSELQVVTWLRGPVRDGSVNAYLFYKGQQIGHTEDTMHGVARRDVAHETFNANTPNEWGRYVFTFFNVQVFNRETNGAHAEGFRLGQNPGEYEVKVLRGGKLARVFKFAVGADGRIADNRIASGSRLDTYRIIVPAQVLGTEDGQWDREAWKAGAFYGNPLNGFMP